MKSPEPELIWRGRIHVGDDPGLFGDASYSGLATELPITFDRMDAPGADKTTLVVQTEYAETFGSYSGHLVTAVLYEPDPDKQDHYVATVLKEARLTSKNKNRLEIPVDFTDKSSPMFVGLRVNIDSEVPPGLYDDFVLTGVSSVARNSTLVASLGFHS